MKTLFVAINAKYIHSNPAIRILAEYVKRRLPVEPELLECTINQYTDDILRNLENTISHSMDAAKARHDAYVSSLQGFLDVVTANRAELNPTAEEPETKTTDAQASQADGPKVEISSDMLG